MNRNVNTSLLLITSRYPLNFLKYKLIIIQIIQFTITDKMAHTTHTHTHTHTHTLPHLSEFVLGLCQGGLLLSQLQCGCLQPGSLGFHHPGDSTVHLGFTGVAG